MKGIPSLREMIVSKTYPGAPSGIRITVFPTRSVSRPEKFSLYSSTDNAYFGKLRDTFQEAVEGANKENLRMYGPVKGEQAGMLGVPGNVHTQKQPWTPGQMEFESYGRYKEAKEQTTVPSEMKLLPNAKQNLYWWTVEQLREECIRQRLIDPTKRYHKKELIDLLEPGMGTHPPFAKKFGQIWDPEKHQWIDA